MRDDQVVMTAGLPLQSIGEVQTDVLPAGLANAAFEYGEHGPTGVDYIRMKTRIDGQQLQQEASVSIAEQQCVARADQVRELGAAATREPRPEAQVFEPSIQAGNGIEVDVPQRTSPSMLCKKKHFQERAAEPQISPLRCASVEMTKGRVAVARQCCLGNRNSSPGKGKQGQRRQERSIRGDAQLKGRKMRAAHIQGKEKPTAA